VLEDHDSQVVPFVFGGCPPLVRHEDQVLVPFSRLFLEELNHEEQVLIELVQERSVDGGAVGAHSHL
jgi:hypothetical protein